MTDCQFKIQSCFRCGYPDIVHHSDDRDPDHVHSYHIKSYPDPQTSLSLISSQQIDNVVSEAARMWNKDKELRF